MAGLQTSELDNGLLGATQITASYSLEIILIYVHRNEPRASTNLLSGPLLSSLTLLVYSRWPTERQINSK